MKRSSASLIVLAIIMALVSLTSAACSGAAIPTPAPAAGETSPSTPTAVPSSTQAPASSAGQPVTQRLRVAAVLEREVNDPVLSTTLASPQYAPVYEALFEDDQMFDFVPMLASDWSMSPDGKTWTVELRRGIQWHDGWGEFTAKDVIHTLERYVRPDSASAWVNQVQPFLDNAEVVDDYQIIFHLPSPQLDTLTLFSERKHNDVLSKAFFDAEGQEGVNRKMIGTGPYQFKERVSGQYILHERVPYEHWRLTPDFQEIQIFTVLEASTRLAMLASGEVHIAILPFDLQAAAVDRGLEVVGSTIPTTVVYSMFGGNYLPTSPDYDPTIPWAAPGEVGRKVREALNRAVDRNQIWETILGGRGEPMVVTFWLSTLPGWDPQFLERFEENYGYDPQRARELLREAETLNRGPLDWSKTFFLLTPRPELAELQDVGEAIADYWREVGVDLKLEQREFVWWRDRFFAHQIQGIAWADATPFRETAQEMINIIYASRDMGGPVNFFESQFIDQKYQELLATVDLSERDQILREVGQHLFDEYATVPLYALHTEFVVDPRVVSEYRASGILPPRHLEYAKAARTR